MEVGDKVKTTCSWIDVPKGSVGYIVEDYGSGVTVAWDLTNKPYPIDMEFSDVAKMFAINPKCPLRDGFDKKTELHFLEKL